MKRRTRLQWYNYHKESAQSQAEERTRAEYRRYFEMHDADLAKVSILLANAKREMPSKERFLSFFGIVTEYEREKIQPFTEKIQYIHQQIEKLNAHLEAKVTSERAAADNLYERSREQRKREAGLRIEARLVRRKEARIRYLERSPYLRQAARSLREWLLNSFGPSDVTCYYCGAKISSSASHLEHKTPISRGGDNRRSNLVIACASCNLKKGTKTEEEFRRGR